MGLFDFFRKGKEENIKQQQPAPKQQQGKQQQTGSLIDLESKQQNRAPQDRPPVLNESGKISPEYYEIQKGDSLSAIAKRQYGDASKWRAIYEANKDVINNPDLNTTAVRSV